MQKKEKVNRVDVRTRNYATEVYPESAPENWLDIISELKIPLFVSPLHDQDKKKDGSPKKPHYHIQFLFDGKKSVAQVEEIIKAFNGVGVEIIESQTGYARYLCHLDNPEKAQYSIMDVRQYGGADYMKVIMRTNDKARCIKEMQDYINQNDIVCFADMCDYAANEEPEWYDTLINASAYYVKEYIKSRTWKLHNQIER